MQNKYAIYFIASVIATGASPLVSHGQQIPPAKPVGSTVVRMSEFTLPPQPVELIGMRLMPDGRVQYQTMMPIAGRVAAVGDAAKQRGTGASPNAVCLYTGSAGGSDQPGTGTSLVLGEWDSRVKVATGTPVEWAVWDINSKDGPARLPYGGGFEHMPQSMSVAISQAAFGIEGKGLNYANYSLFPRYREITRPFDPATLRYQVRQGELTPQKAENMAKLARYIPVETGSAWGRGDVINVAPNRFEGVATRYVDNDKNASLRAVDLLTFDQAGNLLTDQMVTFPYNRKLLYRLAVNDPAGKIVGTFTVFGDGGGKKDAQDPQENRFTVVVTDEKGAIQQQMEWTNGEGSKLAVMPMYVVRRGEELLLFSTNQQKLLKPVEETWLFGKDGKATLLTSTPYSDVAGKSTSVGLVNNGKTRGSDGWFNHTTARFVDAFTDVNGEIWVLMQRQGEGQVTKEITTATPAVPGPAKGLMNFANKLNAMTGQTAPALPTKQVVTETGTAYGDLFVMQFDKNLTFKHQTVVSVEPMQEPVRFIRSNRTAGTDYVFDNSVNTHVRFRNGDVLVERLLPVNSTRPGSAEVTNFVVDEAAGKVYVLSGIPKKAAEGQLLVYSLD